MSSQTLPSTIRIVIHGINISLGILAVATVSEWFEPFDGGGGTGAALLPMTVTIFLCVALLSWINSKIQSRKTWARFALTVALAPWSVFQIYYLIAYRQLTIPSVLYSIAALISLGSIALMYRSESNDWFRGKR